MSGQVDRKIAKLFDLIYRRLYLPLTPAKDRAYTGKEFFYAKWLGQIVICTEIQRRYFVTFSIQCGQDDDGHSRAFADTPTHFEAVHTWHHDIQDQQMRIFPFPNRNRLQAIAGFQDLKAACAEIPTDKISQYFFVLGEENALRLCCHRRSLMSKIRCNLCQLTR